MPPTETIFLTGATGLIGRWLVPALTRDGHRVLALVRDAEKRRAAIEADVAARGGDPGRLALLDGDLARDELGLDATARARLDGVTMVYHLGAAMQFGLALEAARAVNVRGTERVLDLAERTGARRFVLVSGFRVAAADASVDSGGYETTKVEADRLVRARTQASGMALTVVNPATVIGDSESGETTLFWGFSDLVRDLADGAMPVLPGGAAEWMPLVTVDHLAHFMAQVPPIETAAFREHFLLDERTPPFTELIERICRHLGVAAPRRRLPKSIARAGLRLAGQPDKAEALAFLSADRYDTRSATAAARAVGLVPPDLDRALERNIDFLVATRFGAAPDAGRGRLERVGGAATFLRGDRERPALVLLHGLPLDADAWTPLRAQTRLATLAPDLPGLGRSDDLVPSPLAWMRSLLAGIEGRPWLVGHSLGCQYAIEFAHAHPDRVAGVVLVAPAFLQPRPGLALRCAALRRVGLALAPRDRLVRAVGERHRAYGELLHAGLRRPRARARISRALGQAQEQRPRMTRLLAALEVPVVLVAGEHDPISATLPPDTRLEIIPGAGHNVQLDAPAALAALLDRVHGELPAA
jgi:nucleoside-diphosphate-sugar epimerase/pimeloyl-ACP methyl ester carboxylesterase